MSLILALGSNLGNRKKNIEDALGHLKENFEFIALSKIYESGPVDYLKQPAFLNCVAEFKLPKQNPQEILKLIQSIEQQMGRVKVIPKGPRLIDIDIIFWATEIINYPELIVPHPEWQNRDFVYGPLSELPYIKTIEKKFKIPENRIHSKVYTKD